MKNGTHIHTNGNGNHSNGTRPTNGAAPTNINQLGSEFHWDALSPNVNDALRQPLDLALVSERKGRGGRRFSYIEGHTAIDQANQVFGYGGWGYELVDEVTLREFKSGAAYSATVRVTVPGAPSRSDVGFQPVSDDSAEGHETAYKGAVTDALKRALRSFGDRFGNGLYGDPPTSTGQNRTQPQQRQTRTEQWPAQVSAARSSQSNGTRPRTEDSDARNLRAQLIDLSAQQGFSEEQVRSAVLRKTGRDLDELGVDDLTPLIASAADKLQQRQG